MGKMLLERGAQVDSVDKYGRTPLSWAADADHFLPGINGVVELVLDNGADIGRRDKFGRSPLSRAAGSLSRHAADIITLLLRRGATGDAPDIVGWTPLSWAASSGTVGNVTVLLNHGARVAYVDMFNRTPMYWAKKRRQGKVKSTIVRSADSLEVVDEIVELLKKAEERDRRFAEPNPRTIIVLD